MHFCRRAEQPALLLIQVALPPLYCLSILSVIYSFPRSHHFRVPHACAWATEAFALRRALNAAAACPDADGSKPSLTHITLLPFSQPPLASGDGASQVEGAGSCRSLRGL